jgi:hypothetical protein
VVGRAASELALAGLETKGFWPEILLRPLSRTWWPIGSCRRWSRGSRELLWGPL